MEILQKTLKKEILKNHETVKDWLVEHNVHQQRFYNFLKSEYNPSLKTLKYWLETVDLEITARIKK